MTENKRFNCHVKFSAMPNGIMVLDYERHGDEQTVIEDISREKAHRVMDRLNELNDENEQLKQTNQRLNDELQETMGYLTLKSGVEKENEQLKQFKENVFDLIDARTKAYEHKPFSARVSNPANPNYDEDVDRLARLSELQQLRKELKGDVE